MQDAKNLKKQIDDIQAQVSSGNESAVKDGRIAIESTISALDCGQLRVAENLDGTWVTHAWIKQAIMMYFRLMDMKEIEVGPFVFRDKIPLKRNFKDLNVRVVPPAVARFGCFLGQGAVLMPSYVNIGAYVGAGTMVDTWATVGSCAQV